MKTLCLWVTWLWSFIISFVLLYGYYFFTWSLLDECYNESYISVLPLHFLFFCNDRFWLLSSSMHNLNLFDMYNALVRNMSHWWFPNEGWNAYGGSVAVLSFEFWYNFAFGLSKPQNVLLLISKIGLGWTLIYGWFSIHLIWTFNFL